MNNKIISKIISGTALCSMLICNTMPVFAYTKDETVYTKLDTNGNPYKTIVSTHIENTEDEKLINDISDLLNIKNTNGDETYNQEGNELIWEANGSDIYYQGESKKKLPVTCKVKYELDGKEISPEEIAGKSGKVRVILEYTNNEEREVIIKGKKTKMYVPFVVVAGTIIDNSKNKNIEISNGKTVNDGAKTIAMGIALPGMQESLGISEKDLKLPSNIEITMEAAEFKQSSIVTYITPKVLENEDLKIFDELDKVYKQVDTLQSSSKTIVEGANTLKEGTKEYTKKSKEFNSAMNQVTNGLSTVNSNYSAINNGINELSTGSTELQNGASALNNGIDKLKSTLGALPESIEALYNGSKQLNEGINGEQGLISGMKLLENGLNTAMQTSKEILQLNNKTIANEIANLKEEKAEIESQITTLTNLKDKLLEEVDKETLQTTINQLVQRKETIQNRITVLETQRQTNEGVSSKLQPMQTSQEQLEKINMLSKGIQSLEENLGILSKAALELPTSLTQLSKGSQSLLMGTQKLNTGASTLSKGSKELKNGIEKLDTNTKTLNTANNQLTEAAATLSEGANTLSEGIVTFDKEGISKICTFINGDVKNISTRMEKLTELAEEYSHFTMLKEGNKASVKFIMIMDSMKIVK